MCVCLYVILKNVPIKTIKKLFYRYVSPKMLKKLVNLLQIRGDILKTTYEIVHNNYWLVTIDQKLVTPLLVNVW